MTKVISATLPNIPIKIYQQCQSKQNNQYKNFIVDEQKMGLTKSAVFSHCLPLRRNVKATDGVMDSDYCLAVAEAANRKHVQKSILSKIL